MAVLPAARLLCPCSSAELAEVSASHGIDFEILETQRLRSTLT
jgi:hypothetical protein